MRCCLSDRNQLGASLGGTWCWAKGESCGNNDQTLEFTLPHNLTTLTVLPRSLRKPRKIPPPWIFQQEKFDIFNTWRRTEEHQRAIKILNLTVFISNYCNLVIFISLKVNRSTRHERGTKKESESLTGIKLMTSKHQAGIISTELPEHMECNVITEFLHGRHPVYC